jgi:hypothetical protein
VDLLQRLTAPGPKRILALDGGGVRGMLTIGFLERIEQVLRTRHNQPDLRLSDYFDLIGGTSVGAVIAAGLALGMEVADVRRMFLELGSTVFSRPRRLRVERARFNPLPLERALLNAFGDRTLGDASVRTGLCIVTKRADTGSTWPLLNHPRGKFYDVNRSILLRDALRASAAAPTYFEPEKLAVRPDQFGAFVDGGVSMACNPALLMFLIATVRGYAFDWPAGEDRLLLVSLGTGAWRRRDDVDRVVSRRFWNWAVEIPTMLMEDSLWMNQLLLQYLSRTQTPWEIDGEVGDLSGDLLTSEPALTYLRYDVWLDTYGLEELGLVELIPNQLRLRDLSAAANFEDLTRISARAAERQVSTPHFPSAFDLGVVPEPAPISAAAKTPRWSELAHAVARRVRRLWGPTGRK